MRIFLPLLLVLPGAFCFAQESVSVLTQHNNNNRTGWNNNETVLNHTNVAPGKFGLIATLKVDDEVYAQPLIANAITIGNYTGSVLYVATVNNTLYAFNATDLTNTAPLWQVSLNPSGQRSPNTSDLKDAQRGTPCNGAYKDFSGHIGLVGTPVIDSASNTLYVATKTVDNNGIFYAYINALDLRTGQHKAGSPHLITAQVTGTGDGSVSGTLSYQAKYQNQRPALLLYNSTVYVTSASHCDWGPYHGWILGFDATTLNLKYTYNATPNGWAGGIWMAGQGISVGKDGNLYVVTGNGTTNADNTNVTGKSESLIKLSPQLTVLDWFTPANYDYLDQSDLDYGSDGALIIPNSTTTISGSKEGISYVVDYSNMGRLNSRNSQVKDTLEFNPNRLGYVHVHGSPVYAQLSDGEYVYAWSESFNIRRFTFNRNTGTFLTPYQQGTRKLDYGMPGAMLSVSSNGTDTSSAIVWACFPTSGNANNQVRPGTFVAYRANNLSAGELWSSDQKQADTVGKFAKFNSPTVANGKVYVPTFSKAVKVYGTTVTTTCTGNGTGVLAEYFTNTPPSAAFPSTATVSKTEPVINFDWAAGAPSGISNNLFKARFTGYVQSMGAGTYTFYVTADDGVRLWINNQLIIDQWKDESPTEYSATVTLSQCTKNAIRLEYYENGGGAVCKLNWSGPSIAKQIIPVTQLYPPDMTTCVANGTGVVAEYFANTQPSAAFPATATITKTEPVINFDWGTGGPAGIGNDLFKIRFTGYVQSAAAGLYTFYVTGDDGFRLWINNQLVIDKWKNQSATEYSGTITLPQCTKNSIRLEYYENTGFAACKLSWSGPSISKQIIPGTQLFSALNRQLVDKDVNADKQIGNEDFVVYPNPNGTHNLTISISPNVHKKGQISIYNMLGQELMNNSISVAGVKNGLVTIPIDLAAGVYIIKLSTANKTYSSKFVVL